MTRRMWRTTRREQHQSAEGKDSQALPLSLRLRQGHSLFFHSGREGRRKGGALAAWLRKVIINYRIHRLAGVAGTPALTGIAGNPRLPGLRGFQRTRKARRTPRTRRAPKAPSARRTPRAPQNYIVMTARIGKVSSKGSDGILMFSKMAKSCARALARGSSGTDGARSKTTSHHRTRSGRDP